MNAKPRTLGIITNNQHNVFQRNVLAGVREVAAQRGYTVAIDSYAEDPARPQPITLDYHAVDGVLVIANAAPNDLLQAIYESGTPISLVSHHVPGSSIPAVITDNAQGITEMVRYVVGECGRRSLIFVRGLPDQRDGFERENAFRRELMRYNLPLPDDRFVPGDFSPTVAARSIQRLLDNGTAFDAIVSADYLMGIAAAETLRATGLRLPDDVLVVGFGDAPEAEAAGLTTVAADVVEQGRRAARQLISQIEGQRISGVTVLSVRLIVRAPCDPR
ncbi:MAG: LacI family transcriptional regulator [Chloroflexi bacterium]|nr:LacI family transcriptional regulator [Chloroflexota bacterium]